MVQNNYLSHEGRYFHWWVLVLPFLLPPTTLPRQTSLSDTFLTLKPMLSPERASLKVSWCISTDFTSVVTLTGAKVTTIPGLRTTVSTHPRGTVPIPPIL
ncbi:unnamed protein product [Gulo gulo]|uniref:Uncharacterized protein n=1 Tax=Gulo gulo TaxID=48420 RepID=A0A9X9LBP6_GULGU|nr:unnamed protein product [Gulo gulo]